MTAQKAVTQQPLFREESKTIADHYSPNADVVFALGDTHQTLARCPDGFAKLIITSPPYNIGKEYETQTKLDLYLAHCSQCLSR